MSEPINIQECLVTEIEQLNSISDMLSDLATRQAIDPRLLFQKAFMLRIVAMNLEAISKVALQQVLDKVYNEQEINLDWDQIMRDIGRDE